MLEGLVVVDGEVVTRLGTKVDPTTAVIRVDGKRLPPVSPNVYLVLNKPRGVVSTMSDPEGRPHALRPGRGPPRAALPRRPARHRHLRAAAAHQRRRLRPAHGAPVVRGGQDLRRRGRRRGHQGDPADAARRRHARGRPGHACRRRGSSAARTARTRPARSIVELVIHEGRNRIVRRLLDHVGHPVRRLTRTAIGPVQLGRPRVGRAARADPRRARRAAGQRPALRRAPARHLAWSPARPRIVVAFSTNRDP